MADIQRVAVVTGANRGMGLEACRQLAERGLRVVLTARSLAAAEQAAASLAQGGRVTPWRLDVTDPASVAALGEHLVADHGRVDVLVNNAAAIFDPRPRDAAEASATAVPLDVLRQSFETNCLGALQVCRALIPLMAQGGYGRIVNLSTGLAALHDMGGGWPGYRLSKVALNAVTRMLAAELKGTNIKVNAVDPGWVRTNMGGPQATRSVDEGVDTTLWLATLRDDGPSGGFFRDCKSIPW